MSKGLISFIRKHWIALLIVLVINCIVLTNTVLHHPKIGYDVAGNLNYVQVLAKRLPTPQDTWEFFSPPLPYLIPSFFDKVCLHSSHIFGRQPKLADCRGYDGKLAQFLNFLMSIGITVTLWKIAGLLKPGSESLKISMLAMLGILTVYYKTFSQARGEPYVAFFFCLVMYLVLSFLQNLDALSWKDGLKLGIALGLLILSRQWGFFVFPALAFLAGLIYLKKTAAGWRFVKILFLSGLVAFVVGGWFYLHLYFTYGSFTTFNRVSPGFSLSNKPPEFYFGTGLKNLVLFKKPVRSYLGKTFWPIFYSDIWGDYWCYFTCVNNVTAPGMTLNRNQIAPYLGRVNLVSIFPTLLLLASTALAAVQFVKVLGRKENNPENNFLAFLFVVFLVAWAGFVIFLINYPAGKTTNKATYMIMIFMIMPVFAGLLLEKLRAVKPVYYRVCMLGLTLVFAHNLPAMITHFYWVGHYF